MMRQRSGAVALVAAIFLTLSTWHTGSWMACAGSCVSSIAEMAPGVRSESDMLGSVSDEEGEGGGVGRRSAAGAQQAHDSRSRGSARTHASRARAT
jgi:hypothetical protein